ncbi:guanine nucleotide-binding protein g(o) subunit alpha [Anaeramoeba flamelloides]|uniref:Guanine nucleotide-binding protein g(O) subunit alpha n=1 Tax=Anaeramoeba flamelloides TaxID=1746091 RepID=A0AAV8A7I6_9EUKA|nr:guanine nucleotide-binding protein g(o) subunit alpha [Anaeramoeba flamelloides]
MGQICGTATSEEKQAMKQNKRIENMLKKIKNNLNEEIKILLLGAGESGKSTLFKQMKLLQDGNFDEEDFDRFTEIIRQNIITQMKVLIMATEKLNIEVPLENEIKLIKEAKSYNQEWTNGIQDSVVKLWGNKQIQKTYKEKHNEFHLNDSSEYFFKEIERIGSSDYKPTKMDILQARVRTTGIEEAEFSIGEFIFTMVDVGGQRNERRKWIHCFEEVTSVIFVVSLVGYNQTLREDSSINRMLESINLFKEICSSPWFDSSSMILFLNKRDVFQERIKETDLSVCFEDYNGGLNYEKAVEFLKNKFLDASKSEMNEEDFDRKVYQYETCAINTDNINKIFKSVSDTILRKILCKSDLFL